MNKNKFEELLSTSNLSGDNANYLEQLYDSYLAQLEDGTKDWQTYFESLNSPANNPANSSEKTKEVSHHLIREAFLEIAKKPRYINNSSNASNSLGNADSILSHERKQVSVLRLIQAYRQVGHLMADINPLDSIQAQEKSIDELKLSHYDLSLDDKSSVFSTHGGLGMESGTLSQIEAALKKTYCGSLGAEFMHIANETERQWVQMRLERHHSQLQISNDEKIALLKKVTAAEGLERYLHTKYVGQKRFGLEGGDSLIPMLDTMIYRSGAQGIREIGLGMAHRGRLNVLVNILGKQPKELFQEFEGKLQIELGTGDVKYHQGFSSDIRTEGGDVHLALGFNPSHLEIVCPVVQGSVRARQERRGDKDRNEVLSILIHGDAAFAGQGVVTETFNMSQTRGYKTGGALHVVINNQIGFTTSNPLDSRSSLYCTDVAKMIQAPILHVNGDDPEAVLLAAQIAVDYRMTFHKDIVIDLVCYRRHGHNEADEPAATQPMMYKKIRKHPTTRTLYSQKLINEGILTPEQDKLMVDEYRNHLEAGDAVVPLLDENTSGFVVDWKVYLNHEWTVEWESPITKERLMELGEKLYTIPENMQLQAQVKKVMADRLLMARDEKDVDWGFAENLAYASILDEGHSIRLSGQDCGRGTFSHRQAVLHDQQDGRLHVPLRNIPTKNKLTDFLVIDSLLSEEAVLGFEYGYATAEPRSLVIWEAQFGDFANGAQVVIDQFISSGEHKWGRLCGLVMLLPHGYEGMGPEHSSARLERYLQLCAEHNIQVCVPTNASQIFHLLRRQILRPYRRPLIVMTPKSLLRHKLAVSSLDDLLDDHFRLVIPEIDDLNEADVTRVILCSGKVYYDLLQKRRERKLNNIAIIRIEQLYPFPENVLRAIMDHYNHVEDVIWCQEEPQNQGAWYQSQHHLRSSLKPHQNLRYVGRKASAAAAVGYLAVHIKEQAKLVEEALAQ